MMEINQTQASGVDSFKLQQKLNSPAASEEMEKLCFSDSDEDQHNNIKKSPFKSITTSSSENKSKNYSNGLVEGAQLNGKTEIIKDSNLNGLDEISEDSLGDDITLKVNYDDDDPVDEMMEDELLDEKHNIKKDLISICDNSMTDTKSDKNSEKEIADTNKNEDKINNYLEDISSNSSEMEESSVSKLSDTNKDLTEEQVVSNDSEKKIKDENISNINNKKNDDSVENDVDNEINFIEKSNNVEKHIDSDVSDVISSINSQISDKVSDNKCDKIEQKNDEKVIETEKKSDDIDTLLSAIDNVIECDAKKESNSIITIANVDDIISLDDDDDEKDLNLEPENKEENISISTIADKKKTESNKINDINKDDGDDEVVLLVSPKKSAKNVNIENNKSSLIDDDDDDIVFIECVNKKDNKPDNNADNGDLSDDDIIFFEDDSSSKNSESDKTKLNKINATESSEKKNTVENTNTIEKIGEKSDNEIVVLEKDVLVRDEENKDKEIMVETEEQVENENTKKVTENIVTYEEQKEGEKPSEDILKDESCKNIVSDQVATNDKQLDNFEKPIQNLEGLNGNIQKLDEKTLENNIILLDTSTEEIHNNTEIEKVVNVVIDCKEPLSKIEVNTVEKEEEPVDNSKEEILEKSKVELVEEKTNEELVEKSKEECVEKSTEECEEKLEECGSKSEEILEKMDISESVLDPTVTEKSAENLETDDVNIINNDEKALESCEIKILGDELISDNSDNARDIFAEKQTDETKDKSEKLSELSNSKSNQQIETQDEKEKTIEVNNEEPAHKKVKFSDGVSLDEKSSNSTDSTKQTTTEEISKKPNDDDEDIVLIDEENTTLQKTNTDSTKTLKRTLSQENLTNANKKIKVDGGKANEIFRYESTKIESQISKIAEQPHLYPEPKLPTNNNDIKLDFMKRFKRSINSMTKKDLEELVMQKIVESIIHTSEFGELRDIIEKQEQIIEQHRKKVTELTKQFKDLEMVHNRVLKDLETRNQQFIMPVKITRAVGLQVVIPNKVPSRPIPSTFTPGQQPTRDRDILTNQNLQRSTSISGTSGITNSNISPDSKRGRSHQKFTPLRPDTPQNSPLNRSSNTSTPIGNTSSPVLPTHLSQKINAQNVSPQQQHQMKMQQQKTQQHMQQVLAQKQLQQAQQQAALKRAAFQQQQNSNGMVQFPQTSIGTSTSPSLANTMCVRKLTGGPVRTPSNVIVKKSTTQIRPSPQQDNRTSPMMAKQQQQSSTPNSDPAKPTKSFIDLTDEDEQLQLQQQQAKSIGNGSSQQVQQLPALVAIPTVNQQNSRISTYVVNNKANAAHQQQRSGVPVNSRVQGNNNRQQNLVTIQRQLPSSTTATRIVTSQQRQQQQAPVRYSHPAPLPRAPPLLSNPSWKETPPRPAIHISNIETGIVISWTMDDMAERHAEVTSYQIYAYQETAAAPQVDAWRHVGDVKAMLLPMAVTLTQFQEGQRYFFAVRAVDVHNRCGNFSPPKTWA